MRKRSKSKKRKKEKTATYEAKEILQFKSKKLSKKDNNVFEKILGNVVNVIFDDKFLSDLIHMIFNTENKMEEYQFIVRQILTDTYFLQNIENHIKFQTKIIIEKRIENYFKQYNIELMLKKLIKNDFGDVIEEFCEEYIKSYLNNIIVSDQELVRIENIPSTEKNEKINKNENNLNDNNILEELFLTMSNPLDINDVTDVESYTKFKKKNHMGIEFIKGGCKISGLKWIYNGKTKLVDLEFMGNLLMEVDVKKRSIMVRQPYKGHIIEFYLNMEMNEIIGTYKYKN